MTPLFGLGKKKPSPAAAAPTVPTPQVLQMRQQGYSNDQIIQSLQRDGYTSSQIFDAMSQADIKGEVGAQEMPPIQPMPGQPQMQMPEESYAQPVEMPPPAFDMPPPRSAASFDKAAIEEVAESIIDEKWEELMKSVDKIIVWKEETETKLAKIDQKIKDLKDQFEVLHTGILSKVSEYDKGIRGVSTDIKAMEEVFKKLLPTFTANVNELSRFTKKLGPKSKSP